MKVTVYSTTTCPYCNMLKDYLDENNIGYEEKMVDRDEEARKEMMELSNDFLGVPFTAIEKEGETRTVIGFDKGKLGEYLEIADK